EEQATGEEDWQRGAEQANATLTHGLLVGVQAWAQLHLNSRAVNQRSIRKKVDRVKVFQRQRSAEESVAADRRPVTALGAIKSLRRQRRERPEHAKENAAAGDLRPTDAELARIDTAFPLGPRRRVLPALGSPRAPASEKIKL